MKITERDIFWILIKYSKYTLSGCSEKIDLDFPIINGSDFLKVSQDICKLINKEQ